MNDYDQRPGEVRSPVDPARMTGDAAVVFIGRIRSPWQTRDQCPRNIAQARERGSPAMLEIDAAWRPGLQGLDSCRHAVVLYWMDQSRRDIIVQRPRHRPKPTGVFSLRSPARPNPIALAVVRVLAIDAQNGTITIDAIDCLDGTPLLDIKPWLETIDDPKHRSEVDTKSQ